MLKFFPYFSLLCMIIPKLITNTNLPMSIGLNNYSTMILENDIPTSSFAGGDKSMLLILIMFLIISSNSFLNKSLLSKSSNEIFATNIKSSKDFSTIFILPSSFMSLKCVSITSKSKGCGKLNLINTSRTASSMFQKEMELRY